MFKLVTFLSKVRLILFSGSSLFWSTLAFIKLVLCHSTSSLSLHSRKFCSNTPTYKYFIPVPLLHRRYMIINFILTDSRCINTKSAFFVHEMTNIKFSISNSCDVIPKHISTNQISSCDQANYMTVWFTGKFCHFFPGMILRKCVKHLSLFLPI